MTDESLRTASASRVSEAPLVGRKQEIERVHSAVATIASPSTRLILVAGEAGLGKTTLARVAEDQAVAAGARAITARCWEGVDTPTLWPWRQVLRRLGSPATVFGEDRFELLDSIAGVIKTAAAENPLALVFDDLHAADETSILMLQFLMQFEDSLPVLLLGTYDPRELRGRAPARSVLEQLTRDAELIRLAPLTVAEVAALYVATTGTTPSDATADALTRVSEGNPFFALEGIRLLTEKGDLHRPDQSAGFRVPEGARAILRQRLSALADETLELLAVASVVGPTFDVSLLAAVADLDLDVVLELLDAAVRLDVVEETSAVGTYSFDHVLLRETLYEDLTAARRMRLHRAVAEAIEARFGSEGEANLAQLAHHWFKAAQTGDPIKAVGYIRAAAERAVSHGAYEEAVRLFHRALKVSETAGVARDTRNELKDALEKVRPFFQATPPASTATVHDALVWEGDFWAMSFAGTTIRLRDSKGVAHLARLLSEPGRELHVLDLSSPATPDAPRRLEHDLTADPFAAVDVVLDDTAKAQYRARIEELREQIADADLLNDEARAATAKAELDTLVQHLAYAVGLGGRDRSASSPSERARVNVTKAIRDTMKRIRHAHPSLGAHLEATIRTGTFCAYVPDPRSPIQWNIRGAS